MKPGKNKWGFSLLWINLAVGLVALIQIANHQYSSIRDLLRMLAYMLVYANMTGVLGVFVIGAILEKLAPRKVPLIPLVMVVLVALSALGGLLVQGLLMQLGLVMPQHFWSEYASTLRIATPLGLVFALGATVHASLRGRVHLMEQTVHEKELAEVRIRNLAADARLRSLEARIHPHFLFNTLNSISALIPVNPERAEQLVGRLAALLRASLDSGRQPLIPLRDEMAMVKSYIEIEKVRFGDQFRSSMHMSPEAEVIQVPPMSVQSLAENAVKHGIAPQSGEGEIVICAAVSGGKLQIEICDTGRGFDLTDVPAGHGLDNLVERLNALFADAAGLRVLRRGDYCVVEMTVPID